MNNAAPRGLGITIAYWATTVLFCLAMTMSGYMNITLNPMAVEGLGKLGYPAYFGQILGFWKLGGVAALLAPGTPRLKEWAYAGFCFNLTGASASHLLAGDPIGEAIAPMVILGIAAISYYTRPADRSC